MAVILLVDWLAVAIALEQVLQLTHRLERRLLCRIFDGMWQDLRVDEVNRRLQSLQKTRG